MKLVVSHAKSIVRAARLMDPCAIEGSLRERRIHRSRTAIDRLRQSIDRAQHY